MSITLPTFENIVTKINANGDIEHTPIILSDFVKNTEQGLILYFYPKDNTSGCTAQAVDFTEKIVEFLTLGYTVIGVSRDGTKSHENFICKQNLAIPLISDANETLCQHFNVIKEKNMFGKVGFGVERSTFVFDKDGQLLHELRKVKAKEHADKLLQLLSGDGEGIKF